MSEVNSPTNPSTNTSTPGIGYQGERLLDEKGWREEAEGVIKEIGEFVKEFTVSEALGVTATEIHLNLVTLEGERLTVRLDERGFVVVGGGHDSLDREGERIYETPHSLLDNISPGYRQAWGTSLSDQLTKLAREREEQ